MPKQPAIPGLRDTMKKKDTRREQFLAEMDAVVPKMRLQSLIEPQSPKVAKNRAHLFTLFALGNLFLVRQRLIA